MSNKMSYSETENLKRTIMNRLAQKSGPIMKEIAGAAGFYPDKGSSTLQKSKYGRRYNSLKDHNMVNKPDNQDSEVLDTQNCIHGMPQDKPQTSDYETYPCGHKYPDMTIRQHLKTDLRAEGGIKKDTLRYAVVMSEVLSEPVSKKRRHRRSRYMGL